MAYTPVELAKDGDTVVASNMDEEVTLRWDGWLPTGQALTPERTVEELLGTDVEKALNAIFSKVTVVTGAGIDPTGTTVSTSAIQALIDAAGEYAAISFPEGTYVASGLKPKTGQRWFGAGVLKRDNRTSADLITCDAVSHVKIDLTMDGGSTTVYSGNPGNVSPSGNVVNIINGSTYITVRGLARNATGTGVRVSDSHRCDLSVDIYNCFNGFIIGSAGSTYSPGGGSHYNKIHDCDILMVAKNGVFITGSTASTAGANIQHFNKVADITVTKFGDTAIEVGQGSQDTTVSGFTIDGGNEVAVLGGWAYNGILLRDCKRISVSGGTIRNVPSYTNGSGNMLTLGNGIYLWPAFDGDSSDITISDIVIANCTRGVFLQGNNTLADSQGANGQFTGGAAWVKFSDGVTASGSTVLTSETAKFLSSDAGRAITGTNIPAGTTISSVTDAQTIVLSQAATAAGTGLTFSIFGRQIWQNVSISDVVVDGTQLGILDGTWATVQTKMYSIGFYIQSVSGVSLSNCTARRCQNDGFRIGDTSASSSYATDVTIATCRAFNNGQQAISGEIYAGFNLFGTNNQSSIYLTNCLGSDYQPTGKKTQHYGYIWNGAGNSQTSTASLDTSCTGRGNLIAPYNSCGPSLTLGGTIYMTAGNYAVQPWDSAVIYNGSGGHTITMPNILVSGSSRAVLIRNFGTGSITITKNGSGTLWVTSLAAGAEHLFVTNGLTDWF